MARLPYFEGIVAVAYSESIPVTSFPSKRILHFDISTVCKYLIASNQANGGYYLLYRKDFKSSFGDSMHFKFQ